MLALPAVLLVSSVRTLAELGEAEEVYLRSLAAGLAARLETVPPGRLSDAFDVLAEEEPALTAARVYRSAGDEPGDPVLQTLFRGEALFHAADVVVEGTPTFRMYLPFHSESALCIARIDIARDAAAFLVEHTRHHLLLSLLASAALVGFTLYFLWSERRAADYERRRLALEHLAQLGRMSGVLAHEIRNPLGTIKGFVQLALERAQGSAGELLDPVLSEVARLEALVNDLLAYGRPRPAQRRPVSWQDLSARLAAHAREAIGAQPIRFVSNGDLGGFETDPDILTQVLLNLIRNSVEALGDQESGEVRLSGIRVARGRVRVLVEDDGPGLPPEVRERLFEPFTTTKTSGTGLGLSIARKLTEALGGTIALTPRAPRGVRAEILLPEEKKWPES